jgi:hypothetical protein
LNNFTNYSFFCCVNEFLLFRSISMILYRQGNAVVSKWNRTESLERVYIYIFFWFHIYFYVFTLSHLHLRQLEYVMQLFESVVHVLACLVIVLNWVGLMCITYWLRCIIDEFYVIVCSKKHSLLLLLFVLRRIAFC